MVYIIDHTKDVSAPSPTFSTSTGGDPAMPNKVIKVEMQNQFRSCPTCGYRDGFHSMFEKEDETIKWLLICPSCHDAFDIGLTADISSKNID